MTVTLADVQAAAARIAPHAHQTPVFTSRTLDELAGTHLFFKAEHLQRVGAFKFRGAYNAISRLDDEQARAGVVTHSSGNHAQAVALAARLRGIAAHIVMPNNAPSVKKQAVVGYLGRVVECTPTLSARQDNAQAIVDETGGTLISPYNHPDIIAGQGTAALELLSQVEDLEAIVAPVGGGGLISGACAVAREQCPPVAVFAAEPTGADDAYRSKQAGELILQTSPNTIADGLLTSLGDLTWPFVRDHVEAVITVTDDDIIAAMRLLWERAKMMVEPSSATALAAVLSPRFDSARFGRVGVVLTGGNVDVAAVARYFASTQAT